MELWCAGVVCSGNAMKSDVATTDIRLQILASDAHESRVTVTLKSGETKSEEVIWRVPLRRSDGGPSVH
jgi:hypothetical protein